MEIIFPLFFTHGSVSLSGVALSGECLANKISPTFSETVRDCPRIRDRVQGGEKTSCFCTCLCQSAAHVNGSSRAREDALKRQ